MESNKKNGCLLASLLMVFSTSIVSELGTKIANFDFSTYLNLIINDFIFLMNLDIKLYVVLCFFAAIIFLFLVLKAIYAFYKKPEYLTFNKIKYKDVLWEWEWKCKFTKFKFVWVICNIRPICPKDGTPLNDLGYCPMCQSYYLISSIYINDVSILINHVIKEKYPCFRQ